MEEQHLKKIDNRLKFSRRLHFLSQPHQNRLSQTGDYRTQKYVHTCQTENLLTFEVG